MYLIHRVPVRPVLAREPAKMPLHVLLALPGYVTSNPDAHPFNMPGAIGQLLGHFGWDRAVRILRPHIWAPGWNAEQLRDFVQSAPAPPLPAFGGMEIESWRASAFPERPLPSGPSEAAAGNFDIVHVHAAFARTWPHGDPALGLHAASPQTGGLLAGTLRDALVAVGTRLLILQVLASDPVDLAEFVAGGGGPAVLTVQGADPQAVHDYLLDVYAGIVHNRLLSDAGRPNSHLDWRLDVHLVLGEGADSLLRFDAWMDQLSGSLQRIERGITESRKGLDSAREQIRKHLHRSQWAPYDDRMRPETEESNNLASQAKPASEVLKEIRASAWDHERNGAVPLSQLTEQIDHLERQTLGMVVRHFGRPPGYIGYEEAGGILTVLERAWKDEAASAPRVLNANFVLPETASKRQQVLQPLQALAAGGECNLLVDVGPRWNHIASLVTGNSGFPEQALPRGQEGYVIEVLLVSDDFTPRLATAPMWVPAGSGRSCPLVDGKPAGESGPVVLRLRAPDFPKDYKDEVYWARGRLCLYYENNLLQSAAVKVGLARKAGATLKEPNAIVVDYVLTGSFQQVPERFARRALTGFQGEAAADYPVALNLALNDDGGGGHRILLKYHLEPPGAGTHVGQGWFSDPRRRPPPGRTRYNPQGSAAILRQARELLLNCFFNRDAQGRLLQTQALNKNNGKTRDQFQFDLRELARLGSELFAILTGQIDPGEPGQQPRDWTQRMQEALAEAGVIQVARTGLAEYAFPWSLVYDYPLPGPAYRFCDIIQEEWGAQDGVRQRGVYRKRCPHHAKPWHQENVYCPYGFWGLKHVIEQPPSVLRGLDDSGEGDLRDAEHEIPGGPQLSLAVAVTRDPALDPARVRDHLAKLQAIGRLKFDGAAPADDVTLARALLADATLVYFLCHGKNDAQSSKPYLEIGLGNNLALHRIYPKMVQEWANTAALPNLRGWPKRRPLVCINGCHTADLRPEQLLNFVNAFVYAGASGVIGTEIGVQVPLAIEVAERLFEKLVAGLPVGVALYQVRWELVNKGNLLGLAYTLYALADLHIAAAAPVMAAPALARAGT
jgi:hypothetical protein